MNPGDQIPDFELLDQDGAPRRLSTMLADGPVVLFFYPAAMTSGCTKEACHFRDLAGEFEAAGAQRVGISLDGVDKQKQFADKHSFDYPLLSDKDGHMMQDWGAFGEKLFFGKQVVGVLRSTFLIDAAGTLEKIWPVDRVKGHAAEVLAYLKARP